MLDMIRAIWFLCIAAILWFALIPAEMGGVGGTQYHAAAFLLLGMLTPLAFPRLPLGLVWVTIVLFGGAIELAQGMMHAERYSEWNDFAADAVAATVGIVCYRYRTFFCAFISRDCSPYEEKGDAASRDQI